MCGKRVAHLIKLLVPVPIIRTVNYKIFNEQRFIYIFETLKHFWM